MQIAIIGAGNIGTDIAQAVALGGDSIILHDTDEKTLRLALARISRAIDKGVEQNTIHSFLARRVKRAFTLTTELKKCMAAEVVIEAIQDKLAVKQALFQVLDGLVRPNTILATSTNLLSITKLAASTRFPERVIGLHFCRPVNMTRLVEVVRTPTSRQDLIDQVAALIRRSGRTPLILPDTPGLIVNRLAQVYFGEALRLLDNGGGLDEKTVDQLLEAAGFPLGPFHMMDDLGVDKTFEVVLALYEATFHADRYRPHPRHQRLIDAGMLGRKSTRGGFYPNSTDKGD